MFVCVCSCVLIFSAITAQPPLAAFVWELNWETYKTSKRLMLFFCFLFFTSRTNCLMWYPVSFNFITRCEVPVYWAWSPCAWFIYWWNAGFKKDPIIKPNNLSGRVKLRELLIIHFFKSARHLTWQMLCCVSTSCSGCFDLALAMNVVFYLVKCHWYVCGVFWVPAQSLCIPTK